MSLTPIASSCYEFAVVLGVHSLMLFFFVTNNNPSEDSGRKRYFSTYEAPLYATELVLCNRQGFHHSPRTKRKRCTYPGCVTCHLLLIETSLCFSFSSVLAFHFRSLLPSSSFNINIFTIQVKYITTTCTP